MSAIEGKLRRAGGPYSGGDIEGAGRAALTTPSGILRWNRPAPHPDEWAPLVEHAAARLAAELNR
jgi:hypothetical protein